MRDRLIELLRQIEFDYSEECVCAFEDGYKGAPDFAKFFVDHLLENGVVVLPCNIGDALYYPVFATNRVLLYKVISIKLNSKGLYVVCENHLSKSQMTHRATQIGKTIFLTEREAEQALAEVANGTR